MPLSEHEQRILEEIEARLVADDPKFAREVASGAGHNAVLRRIKRAIAGFVLGFAILIVGLFVPSRLVVFGIAGFTVMVPSLVVVATGMKHVGRQHTPKDEERQGWFARMEERWKKRYEGGDET